MSRTLSRLTGMVAALVGLTVLATGTAFASATAYVPGGGGRAHYDHPSNILKVFNTQCGNGYWVVGQWRWRGFDNRVKSLQDPTCEDGPAIRELDPPARATGIRIRACRYAGGDAYGCSDWVRSRK